MDKTMPLIPVILAGGAGSRLWPVSRESHPKPFIRLADGQSLLQKAYLRAAALPQVKEIFTITNRDLFFKTVDEYSEINKNQFTNSFILEPFGRNTAAAIASAALQITKKNPEAVLLILAADHLIADQMAFTGAVEEAVALAKTDKLVTFGIQPDRPETGYGYIEAEGNDVLAFVEKPLLTKAEEYLQSGRYLWNSGIFCFSAETLLREMELHCPEILASVARCLEKSRLASAKHFNQLELEAASFKAVPDNSIDYALMEKSSAIAIVPCNIGWSDIGSWAAVSELTLADHNGNRAQGEALFHNATNCYVRSEERIVSAVGVDNLVIIDTPDALLVADRAQTQEVKHIYNFLKTRNHEAHKLHRTVHRPWGTYTVLEEGDNFKIKRIVVKPGASLSLQMHHHRSEHWVVVSGVAQVINGEREMLINTNESTFIPAGNKHRLQNPADTDLVMIEVQSGTYVGEDDIVRFKDVYGRVTEIT
ncbi:MAG TPA: mannose-1-phosphate guanylyltransferase/mannose-6-phosphate isomerase [Coxiellaceae bacterium]|nr:mannose-1-phosphate guanylyltransferase/mannose-6-phosphate isomerase [Coxiellaceae bacterium]